MHGGFQHHLISRIAQLRPPLEWITTGSSIEFGAGMDGDTIFVAAGKDLTGK